jgi:hypothetical protein
MPGKRSPDRLSPCGRVHRRIDVLIVSLARCRQDRSGPRRHDVQSLVVVTRTPLTSDEEIECMPMFGQPTLCKSIGFGDGPYSIVLKISATVTCRSSWGGKWCAAAYLPVAACDSCRSISVNNPLAPTRKSR